MTSKQSEGAKRHDSPNSGDKPQTAAPSQNNPDIAKHLGLELVKPADDPQDGAALLEHVSSTYRTYIDLTPAQADAQALWCGMTWVHADLEVAALLSVEAPAMRCGKTEDLKITKAFARKPAIINGQVTVPMLVRLTTLERPTLLIDEADTFMGESAELRAMVNGAHCRETAQRWSLTPSDGEDWTVTVFNTYAPILMAGIGERPATIADRSVRVRLQRRIAEGDFPKWRHRRKADKDRDRDVARGLHRWTLDNRKAILAACQSVEFPERLHDRARDKWEPLLAIAAVAGGDWPARAERAAIALETGAMAGELPAGERIVTDVHRVFLAHPAKDRLTTDFLLEGLYEMGDGRWLEFGRACRPLKGSGLARLLQPYGVSPSHWRVGKMTPRGWLLKDLEPVFARYSMACAELGAESGAVCERALDTEKSPENRAFPAVVPAVPSVQGERPPPPIQEAA